MQKILRGKSGLIFLHKYENQQQFLSEWRDELCEFSVLFIIITFITNTSVLNCYEILMK